MPTQMRTELQLRPKIRAILPTLNREIVWGAARHVEDAGLRPPAAIRADPVRASPSQVRDQGFALHVALPGEQEDVERRSGWRRRHLLWSCARGRRPCGRVARRTTARLCITKFTLRGAEIGTTNPTPHRPSGFSSVTTNAVIRVATSAGANREFAVRHSPQCRCPSRRGTLRSMSSARTGRRVGHSRLLAGLFTRILHVEDLRHVVCIVEPVVALPGG